MHLISYRRNPRARLHWTTGLQVSIARVEDHSHPSLTCNDDVDNAMLYKNMVAHRHEALSRTSLLSVVHHDYYMLNWRARVLPVPAPIP